MSRRLATYFASLLTALALAGSAIVLARGAHAQTPDSQSAATRKPVHPIGIGLEEIEYPYPVKFFDLTIEGQQVRTAYMDVPPTGAAKGKTVVLLHGKSFSGNYWAHMIATLTALGYRVVVSDQIGFGKSAKPDIRYRFDPLARNTKICSLGVGRAAIVGHSFGGMLAVYFARGTMHR